MLDRRLLRVSPEVYTKHKGGLTPEEVWEVQEALAQRYLATHPDPRKWPHAWTNRPRGPFHAEVA